MTLSLNDQEIYVNNMPSADLESARAKFTKLQGQYKDPAIVNHYRLLVAAIDARRIMA